jgi:hypothetical protein
VYTRGSVLATVIVQLFISLTVLASLIFSLVGLAEAYNESQPGTALLLSVLAIFATLGLMTLAIHAWTSGSKGSWRRGVKDLYNDKLRGFYVFGHKRSDDDVTRILMLRVFRQTPIWLRQSVYRRIEYVLCSNVFSSPPFD